MADPTTTTPDSINLNAARESHCLFIGELTEDGIVTHREAIPITEVYDWLDVISVLNNWASTAFPETTAVSWQSLVDSCQFTTYVDGRTFITHRTSARLAS